MLKAISEDYTPPKGFKTRAEREAEREKTDREQHEWADAKEAEKQQEIEFRNHVIETYGIPDTLLTIWEKVLDQLSFEVPRSAFEERLPGTFLLSVEEGVATIGVLSPEDEEWLTQRLSAYISRMLTGMLGEKVTVRFEVMDLDLSEE